MNRMKTRIVVIYSLLWISFASFAQDKEIPKDQKYIYNGNNQLEQNNFVNAEAEYRNAISENPTNSVSKFNLGNAYFKNNKTKEALARYHQAQKVAETKADKHKAFHNIGNGYMQQKNYDKAIEAYKNALRNNPTDDESRYNLALAKKMKEEQDKEDEKNKDKQNKDQNKENKDKDKDENKEDKNKNDQDSDKKDDEGKQDDKKDSDKKGDEEKDKKQDDKGDQDENKEKQNEQKQNDADQKKEEQPKQPQPGQLSPQQVQSLLDAMNNEEKKLQEKINAKKAKGVPVKNEKDW